jgi:prolyl oligopeptidase
MRESFGHQGMRHRSRCRHWPTGLVVLTLGTSFASGRAQDSTRLRPPPVAAVRPVTDDYYGTKIVDNYRYFENLKDPEVQQWMKAQADYTHAVLSALPGRDALFARLRQLDSAQRAVLTGGWRRPGDRYFYLKRIAGESVTKLYERDGLDGVERVLVDPTTIPLAPSNRGRGPSTIEVVTISDDSRYVALGITPGGAEQNIEVHVVATATGSETGDVLLHGDGWVSWLPGNRSLFYTRHQELPANAPRTALEQKERSYWHVMGTDERQDRAVFGYGVIPSITVDSTYSADVEVESRYALASLRNGTSPSYEIYVAPMDAIGKPDVPWRRVTGFEDGVHWAWIHGDDLYLLSFKNASHYQVLRTEARHPDLAAAEVVVPASEAVIRDVNPAADALYLNVLDGGINRVLRVPFGAHPRAEYLTAFATSQTFATADATVDGALVGLATPTAESSIYAYDPRTRRLIDTKLQPEGPNDHPSNIESADVKVASYDGTMVPLSIVYPKGIKLDGSHPTLLSGYGAYGTPSIVGFSPTQLAAYELGVVRATCHVRGGGEFGEEWHVAGKGATKPNTWRDFIACAEYLIAQGYTSPAHLAGEAGSAGGILIGRAIEERPDLFAAAIAEVPVADMVRNETTANGVPNISEFGSTKTEAGFRGLYAMSPYANVKDGVKYPAVLVTTGINDPRVDPWEPAKFAARLQAATASGKPVFLRVDYTAGHGTASSHEQALEATVDTWSFVLWQTGHPAFQPLKP